MHSLRPPPGAREARARRVFVVLLAAALCGQLATGLGQALPSSPSPAPQQLRVDLARDPVWKLACLPGLGPTRALAIVRARGEWRSAPTLEDLSNVPGIGPVTLDLLRTTSEATVVLAGRTFAQVEGGAEPSTDPSTEPSTDP